VLFLERTCWWTVVSQMLNLNSASNLFAWTAWVSNVALPSSCPLGYTFWCSVNTPALLVVALHQALYTISGFAFHFYHSFLTSYLSLSLENNMALAETSSFYTTLRLLCAGWSSNAYQPNICGCRLPPL
jgi:hypothetical protein